MQKYCLIATHQPVHCGVDVCDKDGLLDVISNGLVELKGIAEDIGRVCPDCMYF